MVLTRQHETFLGQQELAPVPQITPPGLPFTGRTFAKSSGVEVSGAPGIFDGIIRQGIPKTVPIFSNIRLTRRLISASADGGLPEVAVQKSHLREIFLCKNILAHRQGETPCIGPGCLRSIHFG